MADILLAARGSHPPPTVSKNWPTAFIKRREELRSQYSRKYDYERALNEDPKALRAWFATVQRIIDENGIQPEDIYNFDENLASLAEQDVTVIGGVWAQENNLVARIQRLINWPACTCRGALEVQTFLSAVIFLCPGLVLVTSDHI
jgi:hypothetical protein